MSDDLNLDAMTKEELIKTAEDLGIDVVKRNTVDQIRQQIRVALGDVPDEPVAADEGESASNRVWVMIHSDGKDNQPVPISVNGFTCLVKRGEWVRLKPEYVEVLRNAVKGRLDHKTGELVNVPAYPFQTSERDPRGA